jgi:hypothetical protein
MKGAYTAQKVKTKKNMPGWAVICLLESDLKAEYCPISFHYMYLFNLSLANLL